MMRSRLLLFVGLVFSSSVLLAKEKKAPIDVQLDSVSTNPVLTVHLHFSNTTGHDVYLAKSQACATGDARNVFTITSDGQPVRYTGALETVKAQFPADYIHLAAKGSYDVTTVIMRYAFLPGEHVYMLRYTTDLWDKMDKHHAVLNSNPVTVTFKTNPS